MCVMFHNNFENKIVIYQIPSFYYGYEKTLTVKATINYRMYYLGTL